MVYNQRETGFIKDYQNFCTKRSHPHLSFDIESAIFPLCLICCIGIPMQQTVKTKSF